MQCRPVNVRAIKVTYNKHSTSTKKDTQESRTGLPRFNLIVRTSEVGVDGSNDTDSD